MLRERLITPMHVQRLHELDLLCATVDDHIDCATCWQLFSHLAAARSRTGTCRILICTRRADSAMREIERWSLGSALDDLGWIREDRVALIAATSQLGALACLALSAQHRGLTVQAFDNCVHALEWLNAAQ